MIARKRNSEFNYALTEEDIGLYLPIDVQKRKIISFKAGLNLTYEGDRKVKNMIKNTGSGQVTVIDGDRNRVYYPKSETIDWESIKKELGEITQRCKDNNIKIELKIAMNAVNEKDESKFIAALKRVVKFGSDVFSNVTANVLIGYMSAQGIIP